MQNWVSPKVKPLAFAIHLGMAALITTAVTPVAAQSHSSTQSYSIAAGQLDDVLKQFGLVAGINVYSNAALLKDIPSSGLQGNYTAQQGLQHLLASTGLTAEQQPNGAFRISALNDAKNVAANGSLELEPVLIMGTGEFELTQDEKGRDDVYDQNISSVYADKETIERYKGAAPADMFSGMLNVYSGDARNSGALDPNVRGIQGPGRVPVTIDGTEQAVTVWRGYMGANNRSYIDPNLIGRVQVFKGANLERNVQSGIGGAVVASTLSVDDVLQPDQAFGGEVKIEGSNNSASPRVPKLSTGKDSRDIPGFVSSGTIRDPTLLVKPKSSGSNHDDKAYRLALGARHEFFELLGAYAYRKKGNHFSGKKKTSFYSRGMAKGEQWNYIPNLANIYHPGDEVFNTSNEMESWLIKAKLNLSDEQSLGFGYRDTSTTYGELFPSRVAWAKAEDDGVPQWPLSEVDAKAYNLEYNLNPENNDWVNFYANLWRTETVSDTYTGGGYPNEAGWRDPIIRNTALRNSNEKREGLTLSNSFAISESLDLTLGGRFQREKLSSDDRYLDPKITGTARMYPKAGTRDEKEFTFNFAWKPTNAITVDAGMRYASFWTVDDFQKERVNAGDTRFSSYPRRLGRQIYYEYDRVITQEEMQPRIDRAEEVRDWWEGRGVDVDKMKQDLQDSVGTLTTGKGTALWEKDSRGRYSQDNHPCLTTDIDLTACHKKAEILGESVNITKVKRLKGHGWAPVLSVGFDLPNHSRIYMRHSQAYRFPSLFENTLGFSAQLANPEYALKPEHIYSYELGYIQDFTSWVDAEYADLKLSYFYNRTKNVIDRDPLMHFMNLEKQTIAGLELQGRYDSGRLFGHLGLAYNLKNKVCDESSAVQLDYLATSNCVDDGFVGGYLVSMAMPQYTANLDIGGRLFNRKLEIGSRLTYHYKHKDKFHSNYRDGARISYFANTPLSWDTIFLVDAYANYQIKDNLSVDTVLTNLTNKYYIDPMTRSAMAAPGRTFKLGLTAKF